MVQKVVRNNNAHAEREPGDEATNNICGVIIILYKMKCWPRVIVGETDIW